MSSPTLSASFVITLLFKLSKCYQLIPASAQLDRIAGWDLSALAAITNHDAAANHGENAALIMNGSMKKNHPLALWNEQEGDL